MSLLAHLSLPEALATEVLLLHISLLPRLETLTIYPVPTKNGIFGEESRGFVSLRSLDLPNEKLLNRFLSYPLRDLEILKARNLSRNSLQKLARNLTGLQKLCIEGSSFSLHEIFLLGACFQLEEIEIITQYPLEMDDLDLRRFRDMFRALRSLSITTQDPQSNFGLSSELRGGVYHWYSSPGRT